VNKKYIETPRVVCAGSFEINKATCNVSIFFSATPKINYVNLVLDIKVMNNGK
jgi:hypothetical protein